MDTPDDIHLSTTLTLHEMEKEILVFTLASVGWNQKLAAAKLGISPRVMNYKIHHVFQIALLNRPAPSVAP